MGASVNVQLVVQVMKQLVRGAREFASGGESQMGGDQEVRQVVGGDVSSDGDMVAGGSDVFEDSLVVWGEPQELEDGAGKVWVGGAEVVERGVSLGESNQAGEVKSRGGRVADGNEGAGDEIQSGEKVVMRWWWGSRGAKGAHVRDGAFKNTL